MLLLTLVAFTPKNNPMEAQQSPSLLSKGKAYQYSTLSLQCVKEKEIYSGPHFLVVWRSKPSPDRKSVV